MITEEHENMPASPATAGRSGEDAAVDFFTKQWKVIAGVLGVLVVVVVGYFYIDSQNDELNLEGLTALARIRNVYGQDTVDYNLALKGQGKGAQSLKGLLDISSEYEGTPAGEMAALMAGNALVVLNRPAEAAEQFEKASASDAAIVQLGAMQGLAAVKELQGDFKSAAEQYEAAAAVGEEIGLDDKCFLNAAVCYEEANNKAKAIELYRMIVKKFAMSNVAADAKSGLARLGTAID